MANTEAGWLSLTTCLVVGVGTLTALWLWRTCQVLMTFKRMGVPGPTPIPVFGNMLFMFKQGLNTFPILNKQYGKIYGVFMPSPVLIINDLDLIKDVAIKQFQSFPNRQIPNIFKVKPWNANLLSVRGDQWKHVRGILSPTFSSGKLKKMVPAVQRVVSNLVNNVTEKAKTGEMIELKEFCGWFAMDVIAGVVFGLQVDSLQNPKDPFVYHARNVLYGRQWVLPLYETLPFLSTLLNKIGLTFSPKESTDFFYNVTEAALKERRQEKERFSDFLQLLVEAEKEQEAQQEVDAEIDHRSQLHTSSQWTRKGLSREEVHSNALTFFSAGHDTVSTAMSYTLFCLAANPECLHKAQQEVDDKLGKKPADYSTANELVYLDMCLNEALRMFPPGFYTMRESIEDTEVGGYKVPKGMRAIFPFYAIHIDPEIWPNPTKYDPERHTPEARATRHPCSFLPFGIGPRNCIGMRLAQLELRMALAAVLQRVTPVLCEKSVYPPKSFEFGRITSTDGVWVKFQLRD
ncbi:cytochrome P450 3A56-like [Pomacea canaliculata]|uniref:cytochrome P450 3A56-like n=1 Tax=Pomacea canaliculata TaxID=400727 RepID=UPI000D730672|nr:cytochrome P450 3A56-like [Pomacea canaliculata]XP_025084851.1 cytochrome P450 3A56-like [Pomacea canaliculata]XP_025084852.1 cytochrome P450 3A56-like [Pomacea canaliculata]